MNLMISGRLIIYKNPNKQHYHKTPTQGEKIMQADMSNVITPVICETKHNSRLFKVRQVGTSKIIPNQ